MGLCVHVAWRWLLEVVILGRRAASWRVACMKSKKINK